MSVGPNVDFEYLTFPAFDCELDMVKIEWWLFKLMNGEDPTEEYFA
jgi:hypothetical protein